MGKCVGTVWALWGTVGELWELFKVGLRLGSGGTTLAKKGVRCWCESRVEGGVN